MIRANSYADRFKPPIDDLASMCSNRSEQDQHSLLRSKKLSLETNRRRRDLADRKRHEADLEALRRQEILEKRREKLKEATEKYQRGGKPRKRANSANHSNSMRQLSAVQLENTLRMVYGDNTIPSAGRLAFQDSLYPQQKSGNLYRSNSFDSVQHYAFAADLMPKEERLFVLRNNNNQPIMAKQSEAKFFTPSTQNTEEKSSAYKTPFESKLDRHQQRILEEQDRSLRKFSEALEDVLQDEEVMNSDASSDSLNDGLHHTYDKKDEDAEDSTIAGSLILDDILDTGLFVENKYEKALPKTTMDVKNQQSSSEPTPFLVQTSLTKPMETGVSNDKAALSKTASSLRAHSAGILKKTNANYNENFHVSGIAPISQSEKINKYEALRDSIEVSRSHLVSFHSEGDLSNSSSNVGLQKKSVRFASQLCNEAPLSAERDLDVEQNDGSSGKTSSIPRCQSAKTRANTNDLFVANVSRIQIAPHNFGVTLDSAVKNKAAVTRAIGKPPPHPSTTAPAINEPGYAELVRKPPPVFRPGAHRAPRPERITSDMLNRVAGGSTSAQPSNLKMKLQIKQHDSNENAPTLTRCASDSNLLATLGETDAARNRALPTYEQPHLTRKQHLNSDDPIDYNLEKTPTDQEIDWLWEKVRSCLNRSNGSLAGDSQAPSDISIQSAPSRTALSLTPHVIDGTALHSPNRVYQTRVGGSHFQMPHQRRTVLLRQREKAASPIISAVSQKPTASTWTNDIEDKSSASVSESLNEFLAAEQQCSSPNRNELLAPAKLSAGRRGVILRSTHQTSQPSSVIVHSPHPPTKESFVSIPKSNSERLRSVAPSQLSLEEARLMKSLDRLNDKLKNKS